MNVSRIALGCMALAYMPNNPSHETLLQNADALIKACLEHGIHFFDHADIYQGGRSESLFGELLKAEPSLREKMIIQSKCSICPTGSKYKDSAKHYDHDAQHIIASVEASLERLKTDYLDILLLHRPDCLMEPESIAETFAHLRQSGKVKAFGVSNYSAGQIKLLNHFLDRPLCTDQLEFSLLHNGLARSGVFVNCKAPEMDPTVDGLLDFCRLENISIQAWSPLARGTLSGRPLRNDPPPHILKTIDLVKEMADEKKVSREAILIAWILRHPANIIPVIGTTNPARLAACAEALEINLPKTDWYRLFESSLEINLP